MINIYKQKKNRTKRKVLKCVSVGLFDVRMKICFLLKKKLAKILIPNKHYVFETVRSYWLLAMLKNELIC